MLIPQDFTLAGASNVDVSFQRAGRTIQQEFAMCMRYYFNSNAVSGSQAVPGGLYFNVTYPVPMRAVPSAFIANVSPSAPITSNANIVGLSAGQYMLQGQNSSGSTLGFNYTADAEL